MGIVFCIKKYYLKFSVCVTACCIVLFPLWLLAGHLQTLQAALAEIDKKPIEESYLLAEEVFPRLMHIPPEQLERELEKILQTPEMLSDAQYWLVSNYLLRLYEKSVGETKPDWLLAQMEERYKVSAKRNPCVALFIERNIARWHVLFGAISDGYIRFQKNYRSIIEEKCLKYSV